MKQEGNSGAMDMCNLSSSPASKNQVHEQKSIGSADHKGSELELDLNAGPAKDHKSKRLRAGSLCPYCKTHYLDYDGQINLTCPSCGVISGGCFT
jgi:hypothetical protein